jgi:uncharacterized BrkB/YihY/UPF0761 family membrane protein
MPEAESRIDRWTNRLQALITPARMRLERTPVFGVFLDAVETEQRSGAPLLAGGLAYRLFFWLVAFGLVVASILSFWVRESRAGLESTAESFGLAGVATRSAASAVASGSHARWYFLFAGLVLVVYFGIGAVRAVRVTAFLAWRLPPEKMKRPLRASACFSAILVAAISFSVGAAWVRSHGPGAGLLATVATGAVFTALTVFVFMRLPHGEVASWQAFVPGSIEVGFGLTAMHLVVVYYLAAKLERSPQLYGALGASTVVLVWLFLMARLVVSGLFLNATLQRRHRAAASS